MDDTPKSLQVASVAASNAVLFACVAAIRRGPGTGVKGGAMTALG